jgi:hypothetical protein
MPVAMDKLEAALALANEWQFDAFALAEASGGHPLSTLAYYLFAKQGLLEHFSLKPAALARFLRRMEAGYRGNPYHNAVHAADVLQTLHCIVMRGGLMPGYVDPLFLMACYTAAVRLSGVGRLNKCCPRGRGGGGVCVSWRLRWPRRICDCPAPAACGGALPTRTHTPNTHHHARRQVVHDVEHGGLTNDFLVNSLDRLAVRYNDRSPLENHHLAAAFTLMQQPDFHFLAGLPKAEFDRFRKVRAARRLRGLCREPNNAGWRRRGRGGVCGSRSIRARRPSPWCRLGACARPRSTRARRQVVIELVLATDMKQHFSILSHFTTVHRLNAGGVMTPGTSTSDPLLAMRHNNNNRCVCLRAPACAARVCMHAPSSQPCARVHHLARSHPHIHTRAHTHRSEASASTTCSMDQEQIVLPLDENERVLGLQMALKCADIGHVTATLPVHIRCAPWAGRVLFPGGGACRPAVQPCVLTAAWCGPCPMASIGDSLTPACQHTHTHSRASCTHKHTHRTTHSTGGCHSSRRSSSGRATWSARRA